ncbi:hypothetical protein [Microcoleus vaginatus]|uniref:hypothetical protein n=1 Tax=Microcoleus vaginatus TaxID=119532 RepID=UPI001F60102A
MVSFCHCKKKEEGRRKKEGGRRKKEEGRRKKEEGRRKTRFPTLPIPDNLRLKPIINVAFIRV